VSTTRTHPDTWCATLVRLVSGFVHMLLSMVGAVHSLYIVSDVIHHS
jgi:hypothetical protein